MCDSQFLIVTYCDTSPLRRAPRLRPKNLSLRPWKIKQWRRAKKSSGHAPHGVVAACYI